VPRHACILIVQGSNGEPLSGIKFVVERAQEPVPEMAYVTGPDGHARVGLPPGEATIRFFFPDGTSQTSVHRIAVESGRKYMVQLVTRGLA
jgi:hypothetical protein